jgi:hypothetical protein
MSDVKQKIEALENDFKELTAHFKNNNVVKSQKLNYCTYHHLRVAKSLLIIVSANLPDNALIPKLDILQTVLDTYGKVAKRFTPNNFSHIEIIRKAVRSLEAVITQDITIGIDVSENIVTRHYLEKFNNTRAHIDHQLSKLTDKKGEASGSGKDPSVAQTEAHITKENGVLKAKVDGSVFAVAGKSMSIGKVTKVSGERISHTTFYGEPSKQALAAEAAFRKLDERLGGKYIHTTSVVQSGFFSKASAQPEVKGKHQAVAGPSVGKDVSSTSETTHQDSDTVHVNSIEMTISNGVNTVKINTLGAATLTLGAEPK